MNYKPEIHHRRSIRLKGYDYSQAGLYFITVCTQDKLCLFGKIENGKMGLNEAGELVQQIWRAMSHNHPKIRLNEFIVMPNHLHGIINFYNIVNPVGAQFIAPNNPIAPHNPTMPNIQTSDGFPPDGIAPDDTTSGGAENRGMENKGAINRAPTIGEIVRGFKARCTHAINKMNGTTGEKLWQRNYYEHIIRNEDSYLQISEYIETNPVKWPQDKYYE